MSTVRSIERRMFVRRQADRELEAARVAVPAIGAADRLPWGGIWAGYVVFVGVATLLLFLVMGIGFSNVNPLNASSWATVGGGIATWSVIVLLVATFFGGWVAARRPRSTRGDAMTRAVVLWGLIMLSTLLITGWMAGKAVTIAGSAASTIGATIQRAAPATITSTLQQNGVTITEAQATAISARLGAGDRQGAANTLAQAGGISNDRAQTLINQIAGPIQQQAQTAGRQAAQGAAQGGGAVTWAGFWLALLSLGAALLGALASGGTLMKRVPVKLPTASA